MSQAPGYARTLHPSSRRSALPNGRLNMHATGSQYDAQGGLSGSVDRDGPRDSRQVTEPLL